MRLLRGWGFRGFLRFLQYFKRSNSTSPFIAGTTDGVANMSAIEMRGCPYDPCTFTIVAEDIPPVIYSFNLSLCPVRYGLDLDYGRCELCDPNFYSIRPSNQSCKACPERTTVCPGGYFDPKPRANWWSLPINADQHEIHQWSTDHDLESIELQAAVSCPPYFCNVDYSSDWYVNRSAHSYQLSSEFFGAPCAPGRVSGSILCGECEHGHSDWVGKCIRTCQSSVIPSPARARSCSTVVLIFVRVMISVLVLVSVSRSCKRWSDSVMDFDINSCDYRPTRAVTNTVIRCIQYHSILRAGT